jgi:hypothetical protein
MIIVTRLRDMFWRLLDRVDYHDTLKHQKLSWNRQLLEPSGCWVFSAGFRKKGARYAFAHLSRRSFTCRGFWDRFPTSSLGANNSLSADLG